MPDILCIGAMMWDVIGRAPQTMSQGADVPGRIAHLPGGVALNVAVALARWGLDPTILTALGDDVEGQALISAAQNLGVNTDFIHVDQKLATDCYMAIEDCDGLIAAIADAHSLEQAGTMILAPLQNGRLADADHPWRGIAVIDGNLTRDQLAYIASLPALSHADLRIVPASPGKADRLAPLITAPNACFYLNRLEAEVLAHRPLRDAAEAAIAMTDLGMARVLITDGGNDVAQGSQGKPVLTATPPKVKIARVTGAGDCFLAAHLVCERQGANPQTALDRATHAASIHVSGKDMP